MYVRAPDDEETDDAGGALACLCRAAGTRQATWTPVQALCGGEGGEGCVSEDGTFVRLVVVVANSRQQRCQASSMMSE